MKILKIEICLTITNNIRSDAKKIFLLLTKYNNLYRKITQDHFTYLSSLSEEHYVKFMRRIG